ncbi:hypothetical protein HBI56_243520 [Parastagonospora nodorum]|nr:hypothetical protein HBI75_238890 [Parastagonospora nodorum]KAH5044975.1 hypothetical protein HBI73_251710 [Parastagonospora nodorum]KAH5165353.1 hypothetical protein HBH68_245100 [Parastagonospora nodorum]KAH5584037.1 hypothetical protein HBI45_243940 [Parastagonospora nodorum]KAH6145183.1 hypothetical protein HBI64_000020 [Parastagonospora nodorum]
MLRGGVRAALSSMLFGCGVVVVVFVGPGRCSTVPRRPHLPLRVPGAGYWRVCRLGVMSPASRRLKSESKYLSSIMLRRSCVGSKGLVGPERCSTVPRRPHLPLRVPGAGYWRVCRLGIMSPASSG